MVNKKFLKQNDKENNKRHRLLFLFRQKAGLMEAQYQLKSSLQKKSSENSEK